ncbi:MAG: hypothetical protein QOE14_1235 [Humisphaera sp.]|nr:hypothetical protein [Humisphaera sp.]
MAVDCEEAGNLISARIDGELTGVDEAALDAHLAGCAACRAALEAAALQDAAMVRAFADGRDAAAALARRVEQGVAQEVAAIAPHPRAAANGPWRRSPMRWVGWTAAAAAGFIGAMIFMRPAPPPATPLQRAAQPADAIAQLVRVADISGEVFTCPSDGKPWQPVIAGAAFAPGAKVRTDDSAKCELTLPGGSRVRLNSGSELKLSAAGDMQLSRGQMFWACPEGAGLLRIAAGDAQVTAGGLGGGPAAQLDIARVADAATVTVVTGSAQVYGQGQATTVRGGEFLRVAGATIGVDPTPKFGCEPVTDPLKATRWLDDLLVLLPPDDPELLARVDALLARIVAERREPVAAAAPGPVEHDIRARGQAWAAPIARYALNHLSASADADRAKRRTAARLLADLAPPACVGELIPLLADDDSEVRFHAAAALNRLTGQTLGFSPDRCAADPRDPAPIVAWQEWWTGNRSRYSARP